MPRPDAHSSVMPFGDHLEELRHRLILGLLGLVPIAIAAFLSGRVLLEILIGPVQRALLESGLPATLQATGPLEVFATYMRVSMITALLVGSPWLVYQGWRFIAPGLYAGEQRFVRILVPLSAALVVTGVLFLYYVIFPIVLAFFIGFGSTLGAPETKTADPPAGVVLPEIPVLEADPPAPEIGAQWVNHELMQQRVCVGYEDGMPVVAGTPLTHIAGVVQQYRVSEYIKLFLSLALAFAIGFQMPVVVLLLGWSGLITPKTLRKYRKHVVLGCAIAGAVLTPADPVSMVLLAMPLYGLFELGMVLLILLPASRVAGGFATKPDPRSEPRREPPDAGDE